MRAVAVCHWYYWGGNAAGYVWDDEPAAICRASIGRQRITVWLPRGAKIVFRRPRERHFLGCTFYHYYGSMSRTKIKIKIIVDGFVNKD